MPHLLLVAEDQGVCPGAVDVQLLRGARQRRLRRCRPQLAPLLLLVLRILRGRVLPAVAVRFQKSYLDFLVQECTIKVSESRCVPRGLHGPGRSMAVTLEQDGVQLGAQRHSEKDVVIPTADASSSSCSRTLTERSTWSCPYAYLRTYDCGGYCML